MNIDWFTVIAQIINFLILVWLLKRFLYKPVLNAIDERDRKIMDRLKNAKAKKEEALKEKEEHAQKNDQFQQDKQKLMDDAYAEAKSYGSNLMDEAREDAQDFRKKLKSSLNKMEQEIKDELSNKLQNEVFEIASQALSDLSSANLQDQILSTFITKLKDLKEDDKSKFRHAFNSNSKTIIVSSAMELTEDQRNLINSSLKNSLEENIKIEYKITPQLICGIQLYSNGFKLGWSISEYLSALQTDLLQSTYNKTNLDEIVKKDKESEIIQKKDSIK